jgi:HAD superfamily hydrolase (TIGR01490 family)
VVPASFFDIDGTLTKGNSKGYMITEFANHLMRANLFSKNGNSNINSMKKLLLAKKISYREIAVKLPEIFASSLEGTIEKNLNREAEVFTKNILKNSLFSYTKDLVNLMKSYGLTIGISGSLIQVVRILGNYFDFDLCYGTEAEIKNGTYTGRLKQNLITKEGKGTVFDSIIKQKKIDLSKSFGFGDTAQDIAFLSKVGNPIAVNPNQELLDIAKENGWTICQSEKTIINEIKSKLHKIRNT